MLTRQQAVATYEQGRVVPDRLTRRRHEQYLRYAARMLEVYRSGVGRTRRQLHRDVAAVLAGEDDCPQRRIDAFCKLLDDVSQYRRDTAGKAAELRRRVFHLAAPHHPLVETRDRLFDSDAAEVRQRIADELNRPWEEIDRELFADVVEFHRLERFEGYADSGALLARYNVAQVQVALFDAVSMTVWAGDDLKTILRYAKLARLMHTIVRTGPGAYRIRLDGPASAMRQTRRYGVAMARFLPALLACSSWRMHAVLRTRRRGYTASLELSPADGLTSHLPPPADFDSDLEAAFAERWGEEPRDGWTLRREGEILHQGQKTFVPDFAFHHDDGRVALLEIVGFWTPEYLQTKLETVSTFADRPILLALADASRRDSLDLPGEVIPFKASLTVKDVLARLDAVARDAP